MAAWLGGTANDASGYLIENLPLAVGPAVGPWHPQLTMGSFELRGRVVR